MSADFTEFAVAARRSDLPPLMVAIDKAICHFALSPDTRKRMHLVVEELFLNTVKHGYGSDSDNPVHIAIFPGENGLLTLRYQDFAPAFAPTDFDPNSRSTADGGFGLLLIRGMAQTQRYRREDGANVTELDFEVGEALADGTQHQQW